MIRKVFLMWHAAVSFSEASPPQFPHGYAIRSIVHLTLPGKPVTLLSAKGILRAQKQKDGQLLPQYTHPLWQAATDEAYEYIHFFPKFTYKHCWQLFLSRLRSIPVCRLCFSPPPPSLTPAPPRLRHIFHALVYESKLTAGRLLFKLWEQWLWIEHVALRLLGAPTLLSFLEWCISEVEKKNTYSK